MALKKFGATAEILEIKGSASKKTAKLRRLSDFEDYRTDDGYMYVRVRAISSRVNKNWDGWPASELQKSASTFLGRPLFVDHHNHDPSKARGVVVDYKVHVENDLDKVAASDPYYKDAPDEHKPPTWVELLLEVDAKSFPKLAKAIAEGDIDGVSMGANVERSKCSHCSNWARTPDEYCQHIQRKGHHFDYWRDGKKTSKASYEDCYDINFFELSFVFDPADETAKHLEVMASVHKEADELDPMDSEPADMTFPPDWAGERPTVEEEGIDPMLYHLAKEAFQAAWTRQPSGQAGDQYFNAWAAAKNALHEAGAPMPVIQDILGRLQADQDHFEGEVASHPNDEGGTIEDFANFPNPTNEMQRSFDQARPKQPHRPSLSKCASCDSDLENGECVIHGAAILKCVDCNCETGGPFKRCRSCFDKHQAATKTADWDDGPKDEYGIPTKANYHKADNPARSCGTCEYFKNGNCSMWKTHVGADMVCSEWEAKDGAKESSARTAEYHYVKKHGDKWVIVQKGTGKVLSEHDSEEKAKASFRAMEMHKHEGREFSEGERKKDAENGDAESDGSYPIEDKADLKNAEEAFGRSKDKAKTKRHINERAKELGEPPMGSDKESHRVADTREVPQSEKTVAPEKVDTLRQENVCPICGSTMEDGSCEVCDYTEPPEGFGNPDLTKAQGTDDKQDAMGMDADNAQDQAQIQQMMEPQQGQMPAGNLQMAMGATSKAGSATPVTNEKTAAADLSGGRVNTQERPILPVTRQRSDKPKDQKTISDSGKPVESNTRSNEPMPNKIAENGAQPNADMSAEPEATINVEQVGGVTLDPEKSTKTVDPTGIGGVEPVNKPESVQVDGAVADAVGPHTDTWQNGQGDSAGQQSPVTRETMSSTEHTALEILPDSVKPETTVDLEAPLKEEVGPPTEVFGGDDFHLTDPVTTEAFPSAEDVKRAAKVQMLAAMRVVKAEVDLGITPAEEELERVAELEDEPVEVLNAQLETLSRVRAANVRTASRKVVAGTRRTGWMPGLAATPAIQKSASAQDDGFVEAIFVSE